MVLVLLCSILCDHCSLVFCFSLFLGFALHNIHAFHSKLFLFFLFKLKKGEKKEANCVSTLIFLASKTRLVNLFTHNMSLYLV